MSVIDVNTLFIPSFANPTGDNNLINSNIKQGVLLLGKTGTLIPIPTASAGNSLCVAVLDKEESTTQTTATKVKEAQVLITGVYRVSFDLRMSFSSTLNARGQIYVNGVARGTLRANNLSSYITYVEDISLNAGDLIQLFIYDADATGNMAYCKNFRLYISNSSPYAITVTD